MPSPIRQWIMKKVLFITYHFAPCGGGGVVPIHTFVKYLPLAGYQPVILTVEEDYYENTYRSPELAAELPAGLPVYRARCLEPARWGLKDKVFGLADRSRLDRVVISLGKHLLRHLLVPDRNVTWLPFALCRGAGAASTEKVDLIFATSPPFTSGLIAYLLNRWTRLPYVLDYRDDWVGNPLYSSRFLPRKAVDRVLERTIVGAARRVVCATEESIALFRTKYPEIAAAKYVLIRNGFDPEYFASGCRAASPKERGKTRFVYTGTLTPRRTPIYFLRAAERLILERPELAGRFEIRFAGFIPKSLRDYIQSSRISSLTRCEEGMPPREVARRLCREADICLLFQRRSEGGETAIPGKVYEYLAAGKPVFCMAEGGATVRFLKGTGGAYFADYEDVEGIKTVLAEIVSGRAETATVSKLTEAELRQFSRREQTLALGRVFDSVTQ